MRKLLILISVFIGSLCFGQTPQQWVKYAETSVIEQDYYGAATYYRKALEIDQENTEIWFKLALSLKKTNNCEEAEKAFQEVFDRYEETKYEVSQYWLAEMQKCQGKYEMALINFRDYVRNARIRSIYEYAKARQEVEATQFAIDHSQDSSSFRISALEGDINSPLSEFAPRTIADSVLYFSSLQYFKKKEKLEVDKKEKGGISRIYQASFEDSVWKNIEELEVPGIPEGQHMANACIAPSGDLFFSACEVGGACKIYRSEWQGGTWTEAVALGEMVNIPGSSNTQPFLCEIDGTSYLFFASNQARGRGQMDIWYSKYDSRRKAFARPRNMGRSVNTPGNEVSPFWDVEKGRLYFSSDWHSGFGGFDIQYSDGVPRSLKAAVNPGLGLNSAANDLYYFRNDKNGKIYLASNREGGESLKGMKCCNDIYVAQELEKDTVPEKDTSLLVVVETPPDTVLPDEPDTVITEEKLEKELLTIQTYLPLALYFHNDEPNPRSWDTTTSLSYEETFDAYFNLLGRYQKQYRSLFVGEKQDTAEVRINSFFEKKVKYGKNTMDKALDALLRQLQNEKDIELTIKGFASPLARSDYNLNLTKRRIASFRNYIKKYNEGAFIPFLQDGSLVVVEKAFGESQSATEVSDQLGELARSIYSIAAAKERRIEILSIERK